MSPYQMTIEEIVAEVRDICEQQGVEHLYLFGSYAAGNPTDSSDVDFYVKGAGNMELLREKTEKIPTLKTIDLFDYDRCRNPYLKKDMDLYGKEIY